MIPTLLTIIQWEHHTYYIDISIPFQAFLVALADLFVSACRHCPSSVCEHLLNHTHTHARTLQCIIATMRLDASTKLCPPNYIQKLSLKAQAASLKQTLWDTLLHACMRGERWKERDRDRELLCRLFIFVWLRRKHGFFFFFHTQVDYWRESWR